MKVLRISDLENSQIEVFLAKQKFLPIQQTAIWAKFQKTLGVASLRIAILENEEIVAFAQIFLKKLPLDLIKIEIPRAPLGEPRYFFQVLEEIQKIAKEQKAIFARFEFQRNLNLESLKLQKAGEDNFPLATIRLDLSKSEEEILAQMKPKGRYNIRLAQKHKVIVSVEKSVDAFFSLLQKTTARDGFAGHPKDYYQKMLDIFGNNCELLVAKQNEKPLAAILVTFAGDTATYYFGASDHEFRNLMAPYLIQFEAIKIAKKRDCHFYDFLGVAPENAKDHHLAGVSSFKKKFGGEFIDFPTPKIIIFRPFFYWLFRLAKSLRS
jgi:lipid II:glycine glycyltransferase (peptidoglycan interpeptide bridge formation enzyme)